MEELENRRFHLWLAAALLVIVVGGIIDLALDAPARWFSAHVVFEVAMIAFSLAVASYLWRSWYTASRTLSEVRRALDVRRAERDEWRESARKALESFAQAVDRQFRSWELTPAEREVALLLLKGHSHKRIAKLTDRSERTVRQHAVAVYRKAGLAGRAELAGFFLDDLILPTVPHPDQETDAAQLDRTALVDDRTSTAAEPHHR